jgi:hypothetical protein
MAVLALSAEACLGMVRALDRKIFLFMAGKTFRAKQCKFTLNFGEMTGTTIQTGMGSPKRKSCIGMGQGVIQNSPAFWSMASRTPWPQPALMHIDMAGDAVRGNIRKIRQHMAILTSEQTMLAKQWKIGLAVVEMNFAPLLQAMANGTLHFHNLMRRFL